MEKVDSPMISREIPETGMMSAKIAVVTRPMVRASIKAVSLELNNMVFKFQIYILPL